jgi:hypothetical protein
MCVTSIYHQAQEAGVAVDESVGEGRRHMSHCWFMCLLAREVEKERERE